jgi:hypothetical protein
MPFVSAVPKEMQPSRKLLRAVADLHTRGFQRLRIAVSQYELGTWRCVIAPAQCFSAEHGARIQSGTGPAETAAYTSGAGTDYWGWRDTHDCMPSRLAEELLSRFPGLAKLSYGPDWLYVGWYQHMLHLTYPDALPVTYIPEEEEMTMYIGSVGRKVKIPLPPAGYAVPASPSNSK